MLSTMTRPEDSIRMSRSYRGDIDESDGSRRIPEHTFLPSSSSSSSSSTEGPGKSEDEVTLVNGSAGDVSSNVSKPHTGPRLLSPDETIELARCAVESGIQETKRSLAGSEAVSDVVKPKLTIDLGHSNIVRIPEPVVDIIKDEVERLSLSNNQLFHIPYRFAECSHLRYLNIRANSFREFPKGVYKLPLLEILDLSRNKISQLPEEIKKLTSLRVLSVMQNRLDDLPLSISDMNKLQILKVAGNHFQNPLRKLLETSETEIAPSAMTDNEKEVAVTAELKRFLKTKQPVTMPENDKGSDASDVVLDTPKPVKRGISSRFPVIPSTGELSSDPKSPSLVRPPPIPLKSHYRIASGQGAAFHSSFLQRPIIPGINERNRSNSEGIIQASLAARSKRMGVIRKNTDLGTLDEMRPYRNSHLRGLSHGSILRTRASGAAGSNSPSPSSPRERRRLKDGFVNRMSSLPEHKHEQKTKEPIIECGKGVLFALFQVQSHVAALINVIKRDDARRDSLEIVFYNASTHVDRLNEALDYAENVQMDDADLVRLSKEAVKRECETCIRAYTHVGAQLRNSLGRIVANGDPRYVRSSMLMIYGSILELRNACVSLGIPLRTRKRLSSSKPPIPEINKEPMISDRLTGSTVTPTRGREPSLSVRRFRSDTTIQHPQIITSGPLPTATYHSAVSSPGFGPTPFTFGVRSRSSSRSNLINTSVPSLATPRSGESFPPMPSTVVPRINPLTGLDEIEEERIFERIFHQLAATHTATLHALPAALRHFARCLDVAEQARESEGIQLLWNNLIRRCRLCLDVSDALGLRLSNMKIKEPGGGMRNQREFWQLCKAFMQSFVDLVTELREVRNMHLLPPDVVAILRPVQRASREAGRMIEASPWSYLADMTAGNTPANLYGPPLQSQHAQHGASVSNSNGYHISTSLSPQSVTLPATPLSAALGPAAQATVPSTPASAYSDKFFEGDVFQRADSLLSMPSQAPFFSRR
ncbi:cell morphogenesis protein Sog2 [Aspergillus avenaceus]|uniref:Cell morphogenesis protein Sog2 n=1 Tax=Aspergillus avenaceus TaxID=36643 RepID=A0A5N6TFG3_ASPAV|nr:cell morphogenesis protein Sog2 [Aspergillus avenaceus]